MMLSARCTRHRTPLWATRLSSRAELAAVWEVASGKDEGIYGSDWAEAARPRLILPVKEGHVEADSQLIRDAFI
jgi:hypothetical protein